MNIPTGLPQIWAIQRFNRIKIWLGIGKYKWQTSRPGLGKRENALHSNKTLDNK